MHTYYAKNGFLIDISINVYYEKHKMAMTLTFKINIASFRTFPFHTLMISFEGITVVNYIIS